MEKNFNTLMFDDEKIRTLVGDDALKAIKKARRDLSFLDESIIERVATELEKWAISNGVSHYTHWFYPIGAGNSEKLLPLTINSQYTQQKFSAKNLLKGESDASSFPSGGLRSTFEARGLSRWDYSSPIFIKRLGSENVLFIPTLFFSPNKEALDKKTPLLRSINVLQNEVSLLIKEIGETPKDIENFVGVEQEFFLLDKNDLDRREDLSILGRTIFGLENKNLQYNSHHYTAHLSGRAALFMTELNKELDTLGIIPCAEHREASPNQFEVALMYAPSNVTMDYNQILMDLIKSTADKLNLAVLFDEKPYNGVNGSGKHTNWSVFNGNDNLFTPGKNGEHTLRFLLFTSIFVRAIDKYSSLILSSIVSRSNEFRLGKHEAPPLVLSLFLGDKLSSIFEKSEDELKDFVLTRELKGSDRNRTSPIAFTGNKFEFRAVGASQSISSPVTFINTAFTESVKEARLRIEKAKDKKAECIRVIKDFWNNHKRIVYNENGYSKEWKSEYKERKLTEANDTIKSIELLANKDNINLLSSFGILNEDEIKSRVNVYKENYEKTVLLEASVASEMLNRYIINSIVQQIHEFDNIDVCSSLKEYLCKIVAKLFDKDKKLRSYVDAQNSGKDKIPLIRTTLDELRTLVSDAFTYVSDKYISIPTYDDLLLKL